MPGGQALCYVRLIELSAVHLVGPFPTVETVGVD